MANDLNGLVQTALQRCGQRQSDSAILVPQITLEVPNVQVDLEDQNDHPRPWFLRTMGDQSSWLLTVANQGYITLPASFLGETEDAALYVITIDPSTGFKTKTEILKQDYDDIQEQLQAIFQQNPSLPVVGQPKYYCLSGTQILLFPTPDQAYQLEWSYYSRDKILTAAVPAVLTNNWTAQAWNVMLWRTCLLVAASYLNSDSMAARHKQFFVDEYKKFRGRCIEREYTNHSMHMGQGM